LRIEHFGQFYKEDDPVNIIEIVKMTSYFPSFVDEPGSERFVEEISKE